MFKLFYWTIGSLTIGARKRFIDPLQQAVALVVITPVPVWSQLSELIEWHASSIFIAQLFISPFPVATLFHIN